MNNGTLLDLKKCTIRFGGLTAVNELDLQIGLRDLIGLIGPNGAGKTTIFNIITGVYRPTAGTIQFIGKSIAGLRPNAIDRRGNAENLRVRVQTSSEEDRQIRVHDPSSVCAPAAGRQPSLRVEREPLHQIARCDILDLP